MSQNFLAGLANSVWSALLGLAVVPLYLQFLGIEAYGLIGFFVMMQAVLQLLDMGIAPTINREVARSSAMGNLSDAGKLLHTLAVVYWCLAGAIALFIFVLAPWIAEYWLQSRQFSLQTITHVVLLMGLVAACRWPIGLYQGALIGAQRLAISSGISMMMVTIGNLGAVAVLAFVSPTIEAFFIWQACVGFVHAMTMRWGAWRVIGRITETRFDLNKLKNIWRFSFGISGVSVLGLILNQIDKFILSKMLTLEEFGYYMLAIVVVNGLFVIISPVFNIIYPNFSKLIINGDTKQLENLYRHGTQTVVTFLFPVAMLLGVFATEIIFIWTGSQTISSQVGVIVSVLVVGTSIQGIMYFPYALQLAYGQTKLTIAICMVMIISMIPLVTLLTVKYKALGGALSWLCLNVIYLFYGSWLTHRHLLKNIGKIWFVYDIGRPLTLSVLVGCMGYYVNHNYLHQYFTKIAFGSLLFVTEMFLMIQFVPEIKNIIKNNYTLLEKKFS